MGPLKPWASPSDPGLRLVLPGTPAEGGLLAFFGGVDGDFESRGFRVVEVVPDRPGGVGAVRVRKDFRPLAGGNGR